MKKLGCILIALAFTLQVLHAEPVISGYLETAAKTP
jgi:hypothetical protein